MTESIEEFLKRHAEALGTVRDRRSLSEWHRAFALEWSGAADELSSALNAEYDLGAAFAVRPDVGYIAAECRESQRGNARKRLLLVSANPGWHEVTNPIEARLKHGTAATFDVESYERFRTEFFPRWYDEIMRPHRPRGVAWWNHARIFLHEVAGIEAPKTTCGISSELDLIGWELWPFHSSRDGLTEAAFDGDEDAPSALFEFARASLRAACRMEVDGLIIASTAGFELFKDHLADEFEAGPAATIEKIKCASFRDRATGRTVVTVRRQLFSGFGVPSRATRQAIAAFAAEAFAKSVEGTANAPAERTATTQPSPKSLPLTIEVIPTDAVADSKSPVAVLFVPVTGVPDGDAPLSALDVDDDEETVHERVGGYWKSKKRVEAVRAALGRGRRVLIAGYAGGRVVRVLEVRAEDEALPNTFTHARSGEQWVRLEPQPQQVFVEPSGGGRRVPFATAYAPSRAGREKRRFRYHTVDVEDDALIGRKLVASTRLGSQTGYFAEFVDPSDRPPPSHDVPAIL